MSTPFDRMLLDVSKFRFPADCMPRRVLIRAPEEESYQHDMLLEKERMVGRPGVPLALDPRQFIFIKFSNMLSFWFPCQQDGPVRRIAVYADSWNKGRAFDCILQLPIYRDESQVMCYNGGPTQTFCLACKDQKIVAVKASAGCQVKAPPLSNTLEDMAQVFAAYVQSANLF